MPVTLVDPTVKAQGSLQNPLANMLSSIVAARAANVPTAGENADVAYKSTQAAKLQQEMGAGKKLAAIFDAVYNAQPSVTSKLVEGPREGGMVGPVPPITQNTTTPPPPVEELISKNMPGLVEALGDAGKFGDIPALMRAYTANAPRLKNTEMIDRSMLGAGDSYSSTMGGSREVLANQREIANIHEAGADRRALLPTREEKTKEATLVKGKEDFENILNDLDTLYTQLETEGGDISVEKDSLSNAANFMAGTEGFGPIPGGQTVGRMFGTKNQAIRDEINSKLPLLGAAVRNASGMSSKQMDSNLELQQFLKALTNPRTEIGANRNIITSLSRQYGTGKMAGKRGGAPAAAATPTQNKVVDWNEM